MNGMQPWLHLIEKASLHILQHDVLRRTELRQLGRELPFYVVSFIKEGSCRLRIGGRDYHANQGDVLLVPPRALHDQVKDTGEVTTMLWWHFTLTIADCMDALQLFQFPLLFRLGDTERFEHLYLEYRRCAERPASLADSLMRGAKSQELAAILIESALRQPDARLKADYSEAFTSILNELLESPETRIDLAGLGERYSLHPTYISNQFKKIYGITPMQLQLHLRLRKAKHLLETEKRPIGEVAKLIGYEDADDFSRFFKSKTGISPLKYRNEGRFEPSL
ncbi:helix-turn-helix transcriptional regulator [Paenibacillus glycinis]|uniref:Helix-turn-helix domain-containing protein n=1 Tax=Paenibacillus glycinis TaxID=2697035 RepID=A0ABW9XIA0_9BACL|nr:AraC family transcriptional regulator [Paenibacillus glycinis]NBD22333.1 helix-turn-helix domain-containing protein [Paenibacillus glycinis]